MSEVVGKYRLEVEGAIASLRKLADTSDQAAAKAERAAKSMSDSFVKGSDGAKRLDAELKKQPQTLAEMELKLQRLKELLRDDTKIGTEGFKQVTKAINDTTAAIAKANASLKETNTVGNGLVSTFKSVGVALGLAFGVTQIVAFGKEAVMLAAKAEGVERAFKRIASPELLQGLRDATRGTVTDVVLMQNAVKANNFKIPLDQLATLFKFAQTRARATGESVDYLVDSIILGIGRKSIPILDNLGISAVELKDKLGDTAKSAATIGDVAKAVGDIATAELARVGTEADTAADQLAQLTTVWENFKTKVGGFVITGLTEFAQGLQLISQNAALVSKTQDELSKMSIPQLTEAYQKQSEILAKATKEGLGKNSKELRDNIILQAELLKVIGNQVEQRKKLIASDLGSDAFDVKEIASAMSALDKEREDAANSQIRNIFFLKAAIAELTTTIEAEGTAVADIMPLIQQRNVLQKELTLLTNETKTGMALLNEELATLKTELSSAAIGGSNFWKIIDKIDAKIKEITRAEAMTKLAEALKIDNDGTSTGQDSAIKANLALSQSDYEMWQKKKKDAADFEAWDEERLRKQLQANFDADQAKVDSALKAALERDRIEAEANAKMISYMNGIAQLSNSVTNAIMVGYDNELVALEQQLSKGQITREEYDLKRREIENKRAEDAKTAAIFETTLNGISAVVSAYQTDPTGILAAITAAIVAAEIAAIVATPVPQYATGGWVDEKTGRIAGRKHAYGGVMIEAEGGEFITNAKQSTKHADLLAAVNKGIGEKYIAQHYVKPALDRALLNGFSDIGRSADMNGLTATLKDTNILHALDRNRHATIQGFNMLATQMKSGKTKRGGYASIHN